MIFLSGHPDSESLDQFGHQISPAFWEPQFNVYFLENTNGP